MTPEQQVVVNKVVAEMNRAAKHLVFDCDLPRMERAVGDAIAKIIADHQPELEQELRANMTITGNQDNRTVTVTFHGSLAERIQQFLPP